MLDYSDCTKYEEAVISQLCKYNCRLLTPFVWRLVSEGTTGVVCSHDVTATK